MRIFYKDTTSVLLCFLLINGFFIGNNLNSTFLVIPLALLFAFFLKNNYLYSLKKIVSSRIFINLFIFLTIILITNLVLILTHQTLDLSYAKNIISQIIQLICIIFFIAYIYTAYPPVEQISYSIYIGKLICITFFVQSIIEIIAFLSPQFASIIHIFYSPDQYEILYKSYGGIRGLALTGSPGWGLAVGYAYSFLFYVRYMVIEKFNFKTFCFGLILVLGMFFAGRTAFVGIILGIPLFLFSKIQLISKLKIIFLTVLYSIMIAIIVYFLFFDFLLILEQKVFPFVFEMFYRLEHTGKLETGSTNVLLEMWNRDIPEGVELFGTGLFTDPETGRYYLQTDVGYIRNYLFGGIFWLLLIYSFSLFIFKKSLNYSVTTNDKLLIIFNLMMVFLLELKAMTASYNKYFFLIMIVYLFSLYLDKKNEQIQYNYSCL
ncbi:hypothetical protein DC083_02340 [Ignatzschineria ureiclastica]|uniref:O-antigen ligase domain-containing protein n=1 Tax=Ignatzschineria ureiclastica TaxID=472582 RepID=A0A2U2AHB3_9GAMM|nr:hypothetical protein [Ignatzschineria ureiclastica]PWD82043.1 hypothetical protein DC083_02340 [Ignatzschineria ureiclastica]GGZ92253.1 hypothetical protein GCM10007162_04540 [Ignatzschineria ureiclastica]